MKRLSILTVLSIFMITSLNAKTSILQDEVQEVTETVVASKCRGSVRPQIGPKHQTQLWLGKGWA